MSSVTVITGIIILLAALVCYAFVSQTIQRKQEQRKRILAALKSQSRNFKFVLNGCPKGFLTKDLTLIVLRSLIEVSDQLSKLEPKEPTHPQDLKLYSSALTDTQREAPTAQQVPLQSPQQIKEVKMSLEELHRFIFKLEKQGRVTRNQGDAYRNQVKQLVLRITVDGYILNGQQARQSDKTKLALHYYDLALKLLAREGKLGHFDNQKAQLRTIVKELTVKLQEEESTELPMTPEDSESQAALDNEWDKFSDDSADKTWKKKQVYD